MEEAAQLCGLKRRILVPPLRLLILFINSSSCQPVLILMPWYPLRFYEGINYAKIKGFWFQFCVLPLQALNPFHCPGFLTFGGSWLWAGRHWSLGLLFAPSSSEEPVTGVCQDEASCRAWWDGPAGSLLGVAAACSPWPSLATCAPSLRTTLLLLPT